MTEQKQRRKPRKYTDEFKQQLVELYRSGKRRCDICREYDIATSLFDKWVKQASNSGSFHEKDNRTPEQEELKIKLWDYVNWYNHHRIHSSLGYQTPVQYRKNNLKNLSEKVLTIQFLATVRSIPSFLAIDFLSFL